MFGLHVVPDTGLSDVREGEAEGAVVPPLAGVSLHKVKQLLGICQL